MAETADRILAAAPRRRFARGLTRRHFGTGLCQNGTRASAPSQITPSQTASAQTAPIAPRRPAPWRRAPLAVCLALSACAGLPGAGIFGEGGDLGAGPPPAAAAANEAPAGPARLPAAAAIEDREMASPPPVFTDARDEAGLPLRQADEPTIYPGTNKFLSQDRRRSDQVVLTGPDIVLNFENAELRQVVDVILGSTLGVNYMIDPRVEGVVSLKTTAPVPRDIVMEILETMLRQNGAALIADPDLYRIVPIDAVVRGNLIPEIANGGGPIPPGFSVRLVPLNYVSAVQMNTLLEPFLPQDSVVRVDSDRNLLVLAAAGHEMNRLLDTIDLFDVDWLAGRSVGLFRLINVNAETVAEELRTIFSNQTEGPLEGVIRFVPLVRLNAVLVVTSQSDYLETAETWINRLDRGNAAGRSLYVYYLQHGKAADIASVLSDLFSDRRADRNSPTGRVAPGRQGVTLTADPNTPEGRAQLAAAAAQRAAQRASDAATQAPGASLSATPRSAQPGDGLSFAPSADIRIIADEVNNALLILANEQEYRMVQAALRRIDIVPLQVLIEATIAEVTLTEELRYGLQWLFNIDGPNDNNGTFSLANGASGALAPTFPGFAAVLSDSNGVRGVLDALEGITTLNVISSPHLMVLDNQTAELQVGNEVPVVTQQQQSTFGGGVNNANLVNTVQFRDTGVILRVTPRVSSSGSINMEIEQEVSSVVDSIDTGQLTPTISQRRVSSSIVAQSGETIVLGGLIQDQQNNTKNGLPGLTRIPFIGPLLFGRTSDSSTRTELIVLIRPRVVRNPEEARDVTEELRNRLIGLKELEQRSLGLGAQESRSSTPPPNNP